MPHVDPSGDSNQNGYTNFYEYALGTTALPTLTLEPYTPSLGTASTYAMFRFRRNLAADSTLYIAESTTSLTTPNGWTGTELTYVSTVRQPDGTAIVTYRSTLPAAQLPAHFFARLRAVR